MRGFCDQLAHSRLIAEALIMIAYLSSSPKSWRGSLLKSVP
jgi:hypothetical protein